MFGHFGEVTKSIFSTMFNGTKNTIKSIIIITINFIINTIDLAAPFIFVEAVKNLSETDTDKKQPILALTLAGSYAATWSLGRMLPHLRNMLLNSMGAELATTLIKKLMRQFYALPMEHRVSNTNAPEVQHFGASYEIGKALITSLWGETIPSLTGTVGTAGIVLFFYWDAGLIMVCVLPIYLIASILGSIFLDRAEGSFIGNLFGGFEHIIAQLDQYENAHYYDNVEYELSNTERMLINLNKAQSRSLTTKDGITAIQIMIGALSFLAVSIYMGYEVVVEEEHNIEEFIWTTLYSLIYSTYLSEFSRSSNLLYSNYSKYKAFLTYLDQESELNNGHRNNLLILNGQKRMIAFKDVSFSYRDEDSDENKEVLSGLTFKVPEGKTTVVVGLSGQGKSTILKLLLGFYKPTSGQVKVAKQDISLISGQSLREKMAIVPQSPFLFNGTVSDNIMYGNFKASENEVKVAASKAGLNEMCLTAQVGEKGAKLSGGQKQRVSIARAYLRTDAPFLVLDEPTSSLDPQTEEQVLENLNQLIESERKTTLIITHKLSTIIYLRNVSNIVVLDKGKVAEKGTLSNLLSKQGLFTRQMSIVQKQVELSKESLSIDGENKESDKKFWTETEKEKSRDVAFLSGHKKGKEKKKHQSSIKYSEEDGNTISETTSLFHNNSNNDKTSGEQKKNRCSVS